jgi:hypothetical protein
MWTRCDRERGNVHHTMMLPALRIVRAAILTVAGLLAGGVSACATDPDPGPQSTTGATEIPASESSQTDAPRPAGCALYECDVSCNGGEPAYMDFSVFPGQACTQARTECHREGCIGTCTIAAPAFCIERL